MTQNQIAYWNYKEGKRANIVRERETERSNKAREREQATQRKTNAYFSNLDYHEKVKQNQRNYELAKEQLVEQQRHSKEQEKVAQRQVAVQENQVDLSSTTLQEQRRRNLANEVIQRQQNEITALRDAKAANVSAYSAYNAAKLRLSELSETQRAHQAQENLSSYSNATQRMRVSNDYALGRANYYENMRSHLVSENLTRQGQVLQLAGQVLRSLAGVSSIRGIIKGGKQ